jgi:hypothetical protein
MYSEENEQLAEAAYNNWLAKHPNDPTWAEYGPKHIFRDLVLTYERKPHVRLVPSELEQCVIDAIASAKSNAVNAPPFDTLPSVSEPVAEPEKHKPAKATKK